MQLIRTRSRLQRAIRHLLDTRQSTLLNLRNEDAIRAL